MWWVLLELADALLVFGGCVDAMACVKTKQREVDGKH